MVARVLASGARATFILEGGDIVINWADRKATGTELNDSLAKFNDEVDALDKKMEELSKKQLSDEQLAAQAQAIEAKIADAMMVHYTANKKNAFGWWSLYQYMINGNFSLQQLQDDVTAMYRNIKNPELGSRMERSYRAWRCEGQRNHLLPCI